MTRTQTIKTLVSTMDELSDTDLRLVVRFVNALKQESESESDDFDRWAKDLAKRKKFDQLTETQIAQLVHEYRHQEF